jgi:hypothetical protein
MPEAILLVRLRPYNPRKGLVLRKYTHAETGARFEEAMGWYKVPAAVAQKLRAVHQQPRDADTPLAFDVCTVVEAKEMDKAERRARLRMDADEANDLATSDLGGDPMRRSAERAAEPPMGKARDAKSAPPAPEKTFRDAAPRRRAAKKKAAKKRAAPAESAPPSP